eukprot:GFYU01005172.1.p1 GENE.GFYU01005172.1~~GFYU01005172.1.p1  ORF type:complete len:125 (-),score=33.68 GFYU01005172.1:333-707(-)
MAPPTVEIQKMINSEEELDEYLKYEGLVIIDVHSKWCGPCKIMGSLFKRYFFEFPDSKMLFLLGEVESLPLLEKWHKPGKSKPTYVVYKMGDLLGVISGPDQPKVEDFMDAHTKDPAFAPQTED